MSGSDEEEAEGDGVEEHHEDEIGLEHALRRTGRRRTNRPPVNYAELDDPMNEVAIPTVTHGTVEVHSTFVAPTEFAWLINFPLVL